MVKSVLGKKLKGFNFTLLEFLIVVIALSVLLGFWIFMGVSSNPDSLFLQF